MNVREMLKRTTAVAAIVVLPVAAVAAGTGDNSAQSSMQPDMPQDMTATIQNQLQSPADTSGPDQNGQSTQTEAGQQLENTVERQVQIPGEGTEQTAGARQGSRLDEIQGPESVPLENPFIKVYKKSEKPEASERSTVVKKNGQYLSKAAGWHTGGESANTADTVGSSAQNENAASGGMTGNGTAEGAGSSGQPAQGAQNAAASDQNAASANNAAADEGNAGTASNRNNAGAAAGQSAQQSMTGGNAEEQATVATVNGQPITRADVIAMVGAMPPHLRQAPREMVVPLAVDQLVLRQLILQKAQQQGLADDAQVEAMANRSLQQDKNNAMVQVWLDRQLADAVTDQRVQDAYNAIEQRLGEQTPPLDQIRLQIEDQLRNQAFNRIATSLQQNANIVFYGADGQALASAR